MKAPGQSELCLCLMGRSWPLVSAAWVSDRWLCGILWVQHLSIRVALLQFWCQMTHKSVFADAEQLRWALDSAGAGHQQWSAVTLLWPWYGYSLPLWQGKNQTQVVEVFLVYKVVCFNQCKWSGRAIAASDTLRWQTRLHMSTICLCTAVRKARRAWDTCRREAWRSTSVRLQGQPIRPSVLDFTHVHTKRFVCNSAF